MSWLSDLWKYGVTLRQRASSRAAEAYARAVAAYERELDAMPATPFAPGLQERFGRVRRIEAAGTGEPYADAAELAPYEWNPEYLRLGADGEHTHVVVRRGDEAVYVVADGGSADAAPSQRFASVHHWVLRLQRSEELLNGPGAQNA